MTSIIVEIENKEKKYNLNLFMVLCIVCRLVGIFIAKKMYASSLGFPICTFVQRLPNGVLFPETFCTLSFSFSFCCFFYFPSLELRITFHKRLI